MNLNVIKSDYENLKKEFEDYKEKTDIKIKNLERMINDNIGNTTIIDDENKDFNREILNNNNKLSIIISQYKKSIVVKNMYKDKNTTIPFKALFKNNGASWIKAEKIGGWLFLGKFIEGKTLEENSEDILEIFKSNKIEVEVSYE